MVSKQTIRDSLKNLLCFFRFLSTMPILSHGESRVRTCSWSPWLRLVILTTRFLSPSWKLTKTIILWRYALSLLDLILLVSWLTLIESRWCAIRQGFCRFSIRLECVPMLRSTWMVLLTTTKRLSQWSRRKIFLSLTRMLSSFRLTSWSVVQDLRVSWYASRTLWSHGCPTDLVVESSFLSMRLTMNSSQTSSREKKVEHLEYYRISEQALLSSLKKQSAARLSTRRSTGSTKWSWRGFKPFLTFSCLETTICLR